MTKILETTKSFIDKSIGGWKSIRSTHTLAFQVFENTNSNILITKVKFDSKEVQDISNKFNTDIKSAIAIKISWEAKSDWIEDQAVTIDQTTLVFSQKDSYSGIVLKNKGYAESVHSCATYYIDQTGSLNIKTEYNSTLSFERINFLSENVRFRYSIIKSKSNNSIMQTSHSSEIREISN